jgi:16S rRNA (guanine966-N2)-methyltransferase
LGGLKIRIIAGLAKGCALEGPGREKIRPTPDKVRQALFNIIDPAGSAFLDLFAGTGATGCEAISRGAAKVTMVDLSRKAVEIIKRNVAKTEAVAKTNVRPRIICSSASDFVRDAKGKYDFIFCDPPYEWDGVPGFPDLLMESQILNPGGLFIMECARKNIEKIKRAPGRVNRYGDTALLFFSPIPS